MPLISKAAKALEVVARFGSIRKASEHINTAPSALNKQILNLEREYGTLLFERLPRGMRPTEAGHVLVKQIREWEDENTKIVSAVQILKGQGGGYTKIGIMECLADTFLSEAFLKLRDLHQSAALKVLVGGTAELSARLVSGDIDIAVSFNTPHDRGFSIVREARLGLGAVLPPDHPLACADEIQIKDLQGHPLILADDTLTIGPIATVMLQQSVGEMPGTVMSNSISAIKALVEQNLGISLLTIVDVHGEVGRGDLIFRPSPERASSHRYRLPFATRMR